MKTAEELFLEHSDDDFIVAAEAPGGLIHRKIRTTAAKAYLYSILEASRYRHRNDDRFPHSDNTTRFLVAFGETALVIGFQAGHDAAMKEVARAELEQETV